MSYSHRPLQSHLRHPSTSGTQSSTGQSPALVARINEKKIELENLKQLRDLSAGLAAQMQALEEKLSTLADGTEGISWFDPVHTLSRRTPILTIFCNLLAVATVLSNWHNVLRAIT